MLRRVARTQSCHAIRLVSKAPGAQHSLCSHPAHQRCTLAHVSAEDSTHLGPFKALIKFLWVWARVVFLSNYPVPFLDLPTFRALDLVKPFLDFSRLETSPLWSPSWHIPCMFLQRNFPSLVLPPPLIWRDGWLFSGEIGKLVFPASLGISIHLVGDMTIPWSVCEAAPCYLIQLNWVSGFLLFH